MSCKEKPLSKVFLKCLVFDTHFENFSPWEVARFFRGVESKTNEITLSKVVLKCLVFDTHFGNFSPWQVARSSFPKCG